MSKPVEYETELEQAIHTLLILHKKEELDALEKLLYMLPYEQSVVFPSTIRGIIYDIIKGRKEAGVFI